MPVSLYDYQENAISRMKNGCILCGGVGSGKSRTSLAYYFKTQGGDYHQETFKKMPNPCDLYIITTARKRDTAEWGFELTPFLLSTHKDINGHNNTVVVDSWNNIKKYTDVENAFFIFDEQRVVGNGTWVKSFLKIVRANQWILLSATPGDTWSDYIPVFLANGFYRNRTEFLSEHAIFSRFVKYNKIERYVGTKKLCRLRDEILVNMDFLRPTIPEHINVMCDYDILTYKHVMKTRWNAEEDRPIENASELCYQLRRLVNSDPSRLEKVEDLVAIHKKVIIFYNFDYELELLRNLDFGPDCEKAEWNGHRHEPIPKSKRWVYLVQYTAGAEGWNCVETDTTIFFSQNYSYKVMVQASGRIDRVNTPFVYLHFYHLKSAAPIDIAIERALKSKKKFNEVKFVG